MASYGNEVREQAIRRVRAEMQRRAVESPTSVVDDMEREMDLTPDEAQLALVLARYHHYSGSPIVEHYWEGMDGAG